MGKKTDKKQDKDQKPNAAGAGKASAKPLATKDAGVQKKKKASDIDAIFNAAKKAKELAKEVSDEEEIDEEDLDEDEGDDDEVVDEELMKKLAEQIKKQRKSTKKDEVAPAAKAKGSKHDLFGTGGGGGRKTNDDGLTLIKETEFKNKPQAGTTPQCPFDCDCCFI